MRRSGRVTSAITVGALWGSSPCPLPEPGGIVSLLARTTGSPEHPRPHRGWAAVAWVTLILVGFLLATAVVVALARTSTARWEARRSARAPRREVSASPGPPAADVAGLWETVVRGVVPASGRAALRFTPLKVLAHSLVTTPRHVASRLPPIPRPSGILRPALRVRRHEKASTAHINLQALPVQDDAPDTTPPVPMTSPGSQTMRRGDVPGPPRRRFRRTPSVPRRRARSFFHRQDHTDP